VPSPGELGSSYFHTALISKHGIRKSEAAKFIYLRLLTFKWAREACP
jgi:hypothetical protein